MKNLKPLTFKWKKIHNKIIKKKIKTKNFKHFLLQKNVLGLKSLEANIIKSCEIKILLNLIKKKCTKKCKVFLYCFPNISLTSKSISVRMGKGVGVLQDDWIFVIKKNKIFLEIIKMPIKILKKGLLSAKKKLRIKSKIIRPVEKWNLI